METEKPTRRRPNPALKPFRWQEMGWTDVVYIDDLSTADEQLECLDLHSGLAGIDLEWESSDPETVCLVQLATENAIVLLHLSRMEGKSTYLFLLYRALELTLPLLAPVIPNPIKAILEDEDILKLGVAIAGESLQLRRLLRLESFTDGASEDCRKLAKLEVEVRGYVELSLVADRMDPRRWGKDRELATSATGSIALWKLTEDYVHRRLLKEEQQSDWSRELSDEQRDCESRPASFPFLCIDVISL